LILILSPLEEVKEREGILLKGQSPFKLPWSYLEEVGK